MDIETIYRLYFRDVCLFLQGLTRSETLAEELTQETFFRALDGLKDYDGKQDVRAWLFTVARNAYYDHCRRAKHAAPLEDAETKAAESPDIAQLLVDKDAAFTVHQCLHALEEPYKEVFSLRVFGELPFERIGAIFGHNAAWARVTYYRAKTRLLRIRMQLKHRQRRLRLRRAAGRTTMRNLSIPETSTAIRIRWEMCRMNRRRLETVKRRKRAETPEQRIMSNCSQVGIF